MRNSTEIPQGYKDSPLGVIPKDWQVKRLGDVVDIMSGESPSLFDLAPIGSYPYVKVDDLNNCSKYQRRSREYAKIAVNAVKRGSTIFPKRGAAIMNNKVRLADCDILMDSNMMAILPNTEYLDEEFLYYRIIYEKLYRIADTSTIPQINNKHIIPYKIPLPSLSEQKRIVNLLNTWDKAIEKQSELIEKLKLRKRGLMQQLLTGKKRLLGFTNKWKTVRLGKVAERVTRKNIENNQNVVTISAQHGFISQTEFFNKTIASEKLDGYYLVIKDEFCYNKSYSNGYPMGVIKRLISFDKAVVTTLYICFCLKNHNIVDIDFFELYSESGILNRELVKVANEGGRAHGLLNVAPSDFFNMQIVLPNIEEQRAIALVLICADNDITQAKAKLSNLQSQKRGLMQQLLTGKKRI